MVEGKWSGNEYHKLAMTLATRSQGESNKHPDDYELC
jgi:hypothetical protein